MDNQPKTFSYFISYQWNKNGQVGFGQTVVDTTHPIDQTNLASIIRQVARTAGTGRVVLISIIRMPI